MTLPPGLSDKVTQRYQYRFNLQIGAPFWLLVMRRLSKSWYNLAALLPTGLFIWRRHHNNNKMIAQKLHEHRLDFQRRLYNTPKGVVDHAKDVFNHHYGSRIEAAKHAYNTIKQFGQNIIKFAHGELPMPDVTPPFLQNQ